MNLTFRREPLTERLFDEVLPLLFAHWKEVAHYQDIELAPDVAKYLAFEQAGIVRMFTARQQVEAPFDGKLVGYCCYIVQPTLHYRQSKQAHQDVIYLDPECRGGNGARFIAWCDQQLADEGVQAVYHHVKKAHNFGRLLERQGYELVDLIYAKRLDGRNSDRGSAGEYSGVDAVPAAAGR